MLTKRSPQIILHILRYIYALAGGALVVTLCAIAINTFVITTYQVNGFSMNPTFQNNQLLGVSLLTYKFHNPKPGDVVVLSYASDPSIHFVKRIEGIPGETVPFRGQSIVLGADQYFVIGDNRTASTDSRSYGPINKNQIIGQVIGAPSFIAWP